ASVALVTSLQTYCHQNRSSTGTTTRSWHHPPFTRQSTTCLAAAGGHALALLPLNRTSVPHACAPKKNYTVVILPHRSQVWTHRLQQRRTERMHAPPAYSALSFRTPRYQTLPCMVSIYTSRVVRHHGSLTKAKLLPAPPLPPHLRLFFLVHNPPSSLAPLHGPS
ncbi:unnamed protein product, partial [Ectocarpus sp. 6 AP-2014]